MNSCNNVIFPGKLATKRQVESLGNENIAAVVAPIALHFFVVFAVDAVDFRKGAAGSAVRTLL